MDILIKNMEKPSCCGECPFFKRGANPMGEDFIFAQPWGDCLVSGEENVIEHDISMDCPLVALPEHSDLIDRKALFDSIVADIQGVNAEGCYDDDEVELIRTTYQAVLYKLQNESPVIVEASK